MPVNVTGIVTARDDFVVDFDREALRSRIADLRSESLPDDAIRKKYFVGKGSKKYPPGDSRGWKLPAARLRPLAHVSLVDQVVATALMLCLADRVETLQGDPDPKRSPVRRPKCRKRVVSYGNRLFCDPIGGELHHRWGSAKLYRAYYHDYRTFLSRPEVAAESIQDANGKRVSFMAPFPLTRTMTHPDTEFYPETH